MVKHRAPATGDGRISARFIGGVRPALNRVTHLNRRGSMSTACRASNRVLPSLVFSVDLLKPCIIFGVVRWLTFDNF